MSRCCAVCYCTNLVAPSHEWTARTTEMGLRIGDSDPGRRARRRRHIWGEPVVVPREVVRPMEDITCVKFNESGSEFADKEEGKKKYGIFSEIGGRCPDDILGISPAEEGGKNGEKTIRNCLCGVCTRNGREIGLIRQSTGVDLISVHLPSTFIVSPIRVFSYKSGILPLPLSHPKV